MTVFGEAAVARFAKRYADSRKPLERFLELIRHADWKHFADVKKTFASADYASGQLIFNVGGNKYRVISSVDFEEQILLIENVLTHEHYDREKF